MNRQEIIEALRALQGLSFDERRALLADIVPALDIELRVDFGSIVAHPLSQEDVE